MFPRASSSAISSCLSELGYEFVILRLSPLDSASISNSSVAFGELASVESWFFKTWSISIFEKGDSIGVLVARLGHLVKVLFLSDFCPFISFYSNVTTLGAF